MEIRRLTESDAEAMWNLRRNALEGSPGSFGESVEEHQRTSVADFAERLRSGGSESFVFGAFENSTLIGMAGFYRERHAKRRHKGHVWGVFVYPEYRGHGVAKAMMSSLIAAARPLPGLVSISLSVTSAEEPARRLYLSLGFRPFGLEPRALQVDGTYLDELHMTLDLDAPKPRC
jgi:RimJ/RimL family protein N-acetyltransferase